MKILVVSDTHGDVELLRDIVARNRKNTDLVIHLGDNIRDINEVMLDFPTIAQLSVLGNCDFMSMYGNEKTEGTFSVEKRKIFYTHGHRYNVNCGLEYLVSNAKSLGCNIVMFGHTHVGVCEERDGVLIINPGSISRPRDSSSGSYAKLEIVDNNVKCEIKGVER